MKVKSVRKLRERKEVFDIQTPDNTYVLSNGIISHNSGGGGLKYAASTIAFLGKSKERDDKTKEIVGNLIKVTAVKSRFTKEHSKAEVLLDFKTGLDKYYGLLPIAEKYGIFKKLAKQYVMPDGTKVFESKILAEPEKYYTPEVLALIDAACKKEFLYGNNDENDREADSIEPDAE